MIDLSLFRASYPVEVRYADVDALQHVNNAKYFTYMEVARVHYMADVLGWGGDWKALSIIIARAACDFKAPIRHPDVVRVHIRTARLGEKSFDFEYAIVTSGGMLAALASTVQVAYDYERQQTMRVPNDWREKITAFEPALRG
ncbi:MAG: thioesterase family protein [Anaerolineae bacterium]